MLDAETPAQIRHAVLLQDPAKVVAELVAAPGEWLVIGRGPRDRRGTFSQTAHRIRNRKIRAFAAVQTGTFEATVMAENGEAKIYARWLDQTALGA